MWTANPSDHKTAGKSTSAVFGNTVSKTQMPFRTHPDAIKKLVLSLGYKNATIGHYTFNFKALVYAKATRQWCSQGLNYISRLDLLTPLLSCSSTVYSSTHY